MSQFKRTKAFDMMYLIAKTIKGIVRLFERKKAYPVLIWLTRNIATDDLIRARVISLRRNKIWRLHF